jgi:hypothetical protein
MGAIGLIADPFEIVGTGTIDEFDRDVRSR